VHAGSADRLRPAGLALTPTVDDFAVTRAGVIMSPKAGEPHEAWGVLNPGGVRSADGAMHLFPRLIAEGNFSRIGHAVVHFDGETPVGVERRGVALEPHEHYEVNAGGGGVEDPRVVYVPELQRYVMTYTAFVPYEPRVAIAVSEDLERWQRLGVLRYEVHSDAEDLNTCGNKDAAFFPDVIRDPNGVPSLGILPLDAVHSDIANLTSVRRHERVMAPERAWESRKVGTGAPPVRRPYGWVLAYHAVSARGDHPRYCMGIAVLDLERPSRVLYRTPSPVLEPETPYERSGLVGEVVFPSATSERLDGGLDLFYGAADHVVAAARIAVPDQLPATSAG
jgi:predicted GH43/DUF377 family glycosyl hydrolase